MKEIKDFTFEYTEYTSLSELSPVEQNLAQRSIEAQSGSYSPYSHFRVGAAVLLKNGEIVTGSNQENGAYPSGLCAERVALFAAGAQFPQQAIELLVISASHNFKPVETPIPPCGACRQVMSEYRMIGGQSYPVIMIGSKKIIKTDVQNLLPFTFNNVENM